MTTQQNPVIPRKPARFLWLTFDFAHCLTTDADNITPQIFITLMTHPAINQIKRFTAGADSLGPDDIAQWEPGMFTVQAYRPSLLEVLSHISSLLSPHLMADSQTDDKITDSQTDDKITDSQTDDGQATDSQASNSLTIKVYTQIGGRHYPITTRLSEDDIKIAAEDIETMVQQHEKR